MRTRRSRALVGAAVVLSIVAAACGGGSSASSEDGKILDDQVQKELADQQVGGSKDDTSTTGVAAAAHPATMAEWEKLWSDERAAVVKRIKDNKWGLQPDGETILGPEGFKIDLKPCLSQGWSNTDGITDTEIRIGNPTPLSGPVADSGNISKSAEALLSHYSEQGLFKDSTGKTRKVNVVMRDDAYDPTKTVPAVDELVNSVKVATVWTLGSANTMQTYGKLNTSCVPQLFATTGHPAWGDPVNHPWTTGVLMAYNTEAVLWGTFLEQRLDELGDEIRIGAIVMNNDFGRSYVDGLKQWINASPNKDKYEFNPEFVEPSAPTITDAMTNVAAKNPNVFFNMVTGVLCSQAVTEAAQNGMKESVTFLWEASVCKPSNYVRKETVGDASDGWWILGQGLRDINSAAEDGNAFVTWARDTLKSKGIEAKASGNNGTGVTLAWNFAQVFAVAGQLDGGVTRANLITAARAMDMTHPMYLEGIRWNLNGNKDAFWIEGSEVARWDVAKQAWVQQGDIIELSGKSANCSWDQSTASCK